MRPVTAWAYGVMTVPERAADLLPATLASLAAAGFDAPRVFPDAGPPAERLGVAGRWILALWELYIRNPQAERYALFQDDVLAVRGLREYLSRTTSQPRAYWNLYTYLNNERVVQGRPVGSWHPAAVRSGRNGDKPDPAGGQCGLGALGLVFTRDGVQALLGSPALVGKPTEAHLPRKNIDWTVVCAMNAAGYREYVHQPTLLYHAGKFSTVEPGKEWASHARTWTGPATDARGWLPAGVALEGA